MNETVLGFAVFNVPCNHIVPELCKNSPSPLRDTLAFDSSNSRRTSRSVASPYTDRIFALYLYVDE